MNMDYNTFYGEYAYGNAAECAQDFKGLMPKVIENLGGVGESEEDLSVFELGRGQNALKVVDIDGIAKSID